MNNEQKDLLIGVLEHAIDECDMAESMEFGENLRYLLDYANNLSTSDDVTCIRCGLTLVDLGKNDSNMCISCYDKEE